MGKVAVMDRVTWVHRSVHGKLLMPSEVVNMRFATNVAPVWSCKRSPKQAG